MGMELRSANALHDIAINAQAKYLGLKDIYETMEKDACKGLLYKTFSEDEPELEIVLDNIHILKHMGFKFYASTSEPEYKRRGISVTVSWAKEGEFDQGLMREI